MNFLYVAFILIALQNKLITKVVTTLSEYSSFDEYSNIPYIAESEGRCTKLVR